MERTERMQRDFELGKQVDALCVLEARATELLDTTRQLREAERQARRTPEVVPPAQDKVDQAWVNMAHACNRARELCQPPKVCERCGDLATVEIGWFDRDSEFRCDAHIEPGHITSAEATEQEVVGVA